MRLGEPGARRGPGSGGDTVRRRLQKTCVPIMPTGGADLEGTRTSLAHPLSRLFVAGAGYNLSLLERHVCHGPVIPLVDSPVCQTAALF